jgi:SAM-dependent methyltransferase
VRDRGMGAFAGVVPFPVQQRLKAWGIFRLLHIFYDKHGAELLFQREWAEEFKQNRDRVLEYWREYRDLERIVALCQLTPRSRVLDVGCGISTVLHFVPGERFGIDPLADEYQKLYDYPKELSIGRGTGEEIPFPAQDFDVVFCSNVLDHVTDPERTLAEIDRVLREDGHFVLTVEIFPESTARDPAHPHSMTRARVEALLQEKFKIEFEREAPWIGLRNYVNGSRAAPHREWIVVSRKIST